jgi:hypothetical protein
MSRCFWGLGDRVECVRRGELGKYWVSIWFRINVYIFIIMLLRDV